MRRQRTRAGPRRHPLSLCFGPRLWRRPRTRTPSRPTSLRPLLPWLRRSALGHRTGHLAGCTSTAPQIRRPALPQRRPLRHRPMPGTSSCRRRRQKTRLRRLRQQRCSPLRRKPRRGGPHRYRSTVRGPLGLWRLGREPTRRDHGRGCSFPWGNTLPTCLPRPCAPGARKAWERLSRRSAPLHHLLWRRLSGFPLCCRQLWRARRRSHQRCQASTRCSRPTLAAQEEEPRRLRKSKRLAERKDEPRVSPEAPPCHTSLVLALSGYRQKERKGHPDEMRSRSRLPARRALLRTICLHRKAASLSSTMMPPPSTSPRKAGCRSLANSPRTKRR